MSRTDVEAPWPSQIRAENLSGDCRFGREFTRRNWHFTKQHQACVRRRAILSVAANPNCKSKDEAERVVNEVFESCWPDTRPFDEVRTSFRFGFGPCGGADLRCTRGRSTEP